MFGCSEMARCSISGDRAQLQARRRKKQRDQVKQLGQRKTAGTVGCSLLVALAKPTSLSCQRLREDSGKPSFASPRTSNAESTRDRLLGSKTKRSRIAHPFYSTSTTFATHAPQKWRGTKLAVVENLGGAAHGLLHHPNSDSKQLAGSITASAGPSLSKRAQHDEIDGNGNPLQQQSHDFRSLPGRSRCRR